jgi:periplasmic divalent cation tolerance protein
MTDSVLLTFCTCPDESIGVSIAETLVGEGLAACVNLLPGVRSIYSWQGKLQHDAEVMLLIKSTASGFADLAARLRELHPYDLPEIIAISISHGLTDYLNWVTTCTTAASLTSSS